MSFSKTIGVIGFIVLQWHFSQVHSGEEWSVSAEALVWYPSEDIASIWADVITVGKNKSSWKACGFDFRWDTGFRLGLQKKCAVQGWDTSIYWTWFQTSSKNKISFTPNSTISPEFFAAFLSGNTPKNMQGQWGLLLNILDLEIGWSNWAHERCLFRPFIGLKGGWIHQMIQVRYGDLIIQEIPTTLAAKERVKNHFWGIGPEIGIESKWRLGRIHGHSFFLLGHFSVATLYGDWSCKDTYQNEASQKSSVTTNHATMGAVMCQGFLGLGWEGLRRFRARFGFESQIWMNQLRIATFQLQRLHHDLTLQGLTLGCTCDF